MIKAGIIGASGYAGGELLRILLFHPRVEIVFATSEEYKGLPVSFAHPNLRKITDLKFISIEEIKKVDLLFLALPNGVSQKVFDKVKDFAERIIDLGADFRLNSEKDWEYWYGNNHLKPELLKDFVYGLPELEREKIRKARFVACPGCEATVSTLSLYPAVKEGLVKPYPIVIDAKMSSSQAGKKFSLASHHPERAGAIRSYQPLGHRHTAEVEMELSKYDKEVKVDISATAIDMVRGILVTIHAWVKEGVKEKDFWRAYRSFAQNEPFIRLVKQRQGIYRFPEPKILTGTNFCDIGFEVKGERAVIIGAIDNLVKGTAGQAVQCMNLMFGFEETLGLEFPGLHPI